MSVPVRVRNLEKNFGRYPALKGVSLDVEAGEGPGKGKKVVLVSGDEEYRSEEALTQLAKILATHHGFTCTVLYAIDPKTGEISPNEQKNIPGLESLRKADLLVIATRFRNLPDEQMKEIDDYLRAGKPVVGMRTATHGFNIPKDRAYAHYGNGYAGEKKEWTDGFGRAVRYYFNYSGTAVNFNYRHQAGVDLLTSRHVKPDEAMSLGPWELAIVEEDGQATRSETAK